MLLLDLPTEIRLAIYQIYFQDVILHHNHEISSHKENPQGTSDPHSPQSPLSILLANRQIHAESRDLWQPRILFSFASTEKFLDCFTQPPATTLSKIRRARILRAHPVCLFPDPRIRQFRSWSFPDALSLLPGLQLDELQLGDCWHDEEVARYPPCDEFWSDWNADIAAYKLVERLLLTDGWRTCTLLSPTSSMMTWKGFDNSGLSGTAFMRWLQPGQWRDVLSERDGADSGSTVEIFMAPSGSHTAQTASVPGPNSHWSPYSQDTSSRGSTNWPLEQQEAPGHDTAHERQTLVVIRRGAAVACAQQRGRFLGPRAWESGSDGEQGFGGFVAGRSWEELKGTGVFWDPRGDLSACMV